MKLRSIKVFSLIAMTAGLSACADPKLAELQRWMDETRRTTPMIKPDLPAPRQYEQFRYTAEGMVDPYSTARVDRALALATLRPGGGLVPDFNRRREPLEELPLDSIAMVGYLNLGKRAVALVKVGGSIMQVRTGNYVGQNFGLVTQITETQIKVRELVQDSTGDWTERAVSLQLQEGRK